jgi:hypothetical protein
MPLSTCHITFLYGSEDIKKYWRKFDIWKNVTTFASAL